MKRLVLWSAVLLGSLTWAAPSVIADGPGANAAEAKDKSKDKDKAKAKARSAKKPASPAPAKVFTEDDLKKYADDPEGKPKSKSADSAAPADDDSALPEEERHGGRQVWADRAEVARDRIAEAETRIAVLEARIAQLRTDRGVEGAMEPFRLQRIEADIRKATEELEAANKELVAGRAEQEKLFQDARQRGVPLGWLREP